MPQTEMVHGVTLIHDFGQTNAQLTDVSYSENAIPHYMDIGEIGFTDRNPLFTYSSAAGTIVAIKSESGKWGLFSNSFLDRKTRNEEIDDPEERNETKTLEDFLDSWQGAKPPAEVAFVFGASFFSDTFDTSAYRKRIVEMITSVTALPPERVVERWNQDDIPDAEVDVAIHPLINTIRLNEADPALATAS